MDQLEKQLKLARDLMELNTEGFRKLADFDSNNFNSFVELNRDFVSKLPEVKDVEGFIGLQREYGEKLWNSTQDAVTARGELLREVFDDGNTRIRKAFRSESEAEPKAKRPAASKATS